MVLAKHHGCFGKRAGRVPPIKIKRLARSGSALSVF